MNRIGFPRPRMDEEERIALLPEDITEHVEHPEFLYFQRGYGIDCEVPDEAYLETGANVVTERQSSGLEIMCQPKFCEDDIPHIKKDQIIFGWLHLERRSEEVKKLERKLVTAVAWEKMYKNGKNVFERNGGMTGEIGVMHAMPYAGKMPSECYVAVIGNGRVGKGALRQLKRLGVSDIVIYNSRNIQLLRRWISKYDVVVHCAAAVESILSRKDLKMMKRGALLVHLGSDCLDGEFGAQSIYSPIDWVNHGRNPVYCVNHVPTLAYRTASRCISQDAVPYIDMLIKGETDNTLRNAVVMDKGCFMNR